MAAGGGPVVVAQTPRLTLRRITLGDLEMLTELHGDPVVMRFLGAPESVEKVRDEVLPRYLAEHQLHGGIGHWAAEERSAGTCIGWFALQPTDDGPGTLELGYRLRPTAWGRGLATEGSTGLLRLAFERYGADRVIAMTMTVNARSRAVMERLGMRFVRTFHAEWSEHVEGAEDGDVEYAIDRADWIS